MTTSVSYPFDPSGSLASNLVSNEEHSLVLSDSGYMFVVPFAAPFVKTTLKVVLYPGGKVLKEGVDFVCTHFFKTASVSIAKGIYGSITFFNKLLTGKVRLTYQTIGGDWAINQAKALAVMSNTLLNPRIAYWEQIADLPYAFPPINHTWSVDTLFGMKEVVAELGKITAAIRARGTSGGTRDVLDHMANMANPHQVNKAQVGLSLVPNLRLALDSEASAGIRNDLFMTPHTTKILADRLISENIIPAGLSINDTAAESTTVWSGAKVNSSLLALNNAIATAGVFTKDTKFNYHGNSSELLLITTGTDNVGLGRNALRDTTTGGYNIGFGSGALSKVIGGVGNIGIGKGAGTAIETATGNVIVGNGAAVATTRSYNTAIGYAAMAGDTIGDHNTCVGAGADVDAVNLSYATALGAGARVFSNDTVVLGRSNDTVVIGAGIKDASNAKLQVTGYIKATSPELADNSTLVATTAFVKAALSAQSFEVLRRSYAEAGLNLVEGSFEEGGTLTSANDVLLHKVSGIAYSGPIGNVAAGTDPTSGGFVDRSDETGFGSTGRGRLTISTGAPTGIPLENEEWVMIGDVG